MSNFAFTRYFETIAELQAFLTKVGDDTPGTSTKATKGEATKGEATKGEATKGTKTKPKVSQEEMQAALNKVKETLGVPAAKAIIKEAGGVAKMDDIPEAKYEAVFKACEEKLAEEAGGDEEDEDGI